MVQRVIGPTVKIAPVIKANAYGHGMLEVAQSLKNSPIWGFCVAYGEEAIALRQAYRGRILVMSAWQAAELPRILRHKIEVAIWDREGWNLIQRTAARLRQPAVVHLKLDSGTSRIGFRIEELPWLRAQVKKDSRWVTVKGVFSHLANSEERTSLRTVRQVQVFDTMRQGIPANEYHAACTASALRYPASRYSFVRLGIGLYGLWPSAPIREWMLKHYPDFSLSPVMTWKTKILQIKKIPRHTFVGYGGTYQSKKAMSIGLLPVGYSEGYDRLLSNIGWVMIGTKRAPLIGRVSMNLFAVDLTAIPRAQRGTEVILLGPSISAETIGGLTDRIDYEITSRLSPLIPRVLVA